MIVNMPNKEGVTLATEGKYCAENIEVVPTFEMSEGNTLNEFLKGTKTDITAEDLAGVTQIRDYTFYESPIESIELPNSVINIGEQTFSRSNLKSIKIPEAVTTIGYGVFNSCSRLKNVELGKNITYLGNYAFAVCSSLTSIDISNITNTGSGPFDNSGLTHITIPGTLRSVRTYFCRNCKALTSVRMENGVNEIASYAFQNCTSLMEIICLSTNPPTLDATALNGVPADCIFKVKSASVEAYKTETNWSVRADYIIALTPEEEALYGG